ncbi:MAG: hypothetical protein AB7H88_02105 [Vicinamibacterales bacterium]
MTPARLRPAIAVALALSVGCAARLPPRPSGTSTPDPSALAAFAAATGHCAGLRTLTAELRLAGRAGDQRVRGRLIAGLEAPRSVRLEAVAPFGPPVFILAARDGRGVLLLPRDQRVLDPADVGEVLERLTGLALGAADLRLLLTGCVADDPAPADGRAWPGGWRSVVVGGDRTVYLRQEAGAWRVAAADVGDWHVDYDDLLNGYPRQVRLRAPGVDLGAAVSQLQVNVPIVPEAFEVAVPDGTRPMTLDELKSVAPLRDGGTGATSPRSR